MSTSPGKDKDEMKWMYGGPSALFDREAYLTGRKLDKNFEIFSGETRSEAPKGVDAVIKKRTNTKPPVSSLLDLQTIKKEDPLVAIKVEEDKVRREIVENPMQMKKLQNMVMSAMEKKMKKMLKSKEKTKKRHRHDSSSSEEETRNRHRSRNNDNSSKSSRNSERYRHYSPDRRRGYDREKQQNSRNSGNDNRSRSSKTYSPRKRSPPRKSRSRSPVVARKRSPSNSDSDTERKKQKFAGYGLIKVKKDTSPPRSYRKSPSPRSSLNPDRKERYVRKPREKLTEEEKEKRRREMEENAKWRDEQRTKSLQKMEKREKEEEEYEKRRKGKGADFVKPMLASAAARDTVEDRIKRKIHTVQRQYGSMDKNFARK